MIVVKKYKVYSFYKIQVTVYDDIQTLVLT